MHPRRLGLAPSCRSARAPRSAAAARRRVPLPRTPPCRGPRSDPDEIGAGPSTSGPLTLRSALLRSKSSCRPSRPASGRSSVTATGTPESVSSSMMTKRPSSCRSVTFHTEEILVGLDHVADQAPEPHEGSSGRRVVVGLALRDAALGQRNGRCRPQEPQQNEESGQSRETTGLARVAVRSGHLQHGNPHGNEHCNEPSGSLVTVLGIPRVAKHDGYRLSRYKWVTEATLGHSKLEQALLTPTLEPGEGGAWRGILETPYRPLDSL